MSRTVIAAVVAVVITALTAIAFFVTQASFNDKIRTGAEAQLSRAYQVVQQLGQLEAIDVANKAERLAADHSFVAALNTTSTDERQKQARIGFADFTSNEKEGDTKPDIIALVDANGNVVAMNDVPSFVATQWKPAGATASDRTSIIPALKAVLDNNHSHLTISDIWNYQDQLMRIGVAPVVNTDAPPTTDETAGVPVIGAIVVAYSQTAQGAQSDKRQLGTEIAYFDTTRVFASSFTHGTNEEDTGVSKRIGELLKSRQITTENKNPKLVHLEDTDYLAAAVPLPRSISSSRLMPKDYPAITSGAMVLSPISDASNTVGRIKLVILVLGIGALAMSMLGLYLSHRRLVAQVDQIELGVTDIINGNVDRTFRPVGLELDGLANGLNVMLARLLGRPEPGEEEFDEDGNPIIPGRVEFEEGEDKPQTDPDLAALAQESEPDYYKRVFTEYVAARKAVGSPDDVSFENFIAKLKVNEGKLKAQYQCRAVRFRVVTKDNKVSLKPVPIFA